MYRILSIFMLTTVIEISSWAAPLSTRMDDYVTAAEKECSNWTEQDWELSKQEYRKLLDEYKLNKDTYTQAEKDAINKAIGRYNGLLVKHGIEDLTQYLKSLGERIPSFIEGFMSAFENASAETAATDKK